MAVKRSAALVFLISDSGEGYITVDGNQGDRYIMLSIAKIRNEDLYIIASLIFFSETTLPHGMEETLSYSLWQLKIIIQLSS